jgi:hypothetical protein
MKPKVNIVALVDVVGALSDMTLHNGNLSLVDDGSFDSPGQGTPDLCTVVAPGQVVQWTALAVDVQTPVEIQNITFFGPGDPGPAGAPGAVPGDPGAAGVPGAVPGDPGAAGVPGAAPADAGVAAGPGPSDAGQAGAGQDGAGQDGAGQAGENLDLKVWSGVVPGYLIPGATYRYRVELRMHQGPNSVLSIDSPALIRA